MQDFVPGRVVTAPRGGMTVVVLAMFPSGSVYGTGDGGGIGDRWCSCEGEDDGVYYEALSGPDRGSHGWVCRACRGIVQVG